MTRSRDLSLGRLRLARISSSILLIPFGRRPAGDETAVYRAMFDQSSEGRFVTDPLMVILHTNPAATLLFRAAENALYGVPFSELLAPGSRPRFASTIDSMKRSPSRAGPLPLEGRRSDGALFAIEAEIIHGSELRYGIIVREVRSPDTPSRPAGGFNPGQMLIARRIEELV